MSVAAMNWIAGRYKPFSDSDAPASRRQILNHLNRHSEETAVNLKSLQIELSQIAHRIEELARKLNGK